MFFNLLLTASRKPVRRFGIRGNGSMSKVIDFPDGKEEMITVQDVLEKAQSMDLNTALVIGVDEEGILYLSSNNNDPAAFIWMLKKVEKYILEHF